MVSNIKEVFLSDFCYLIAFPAFQVEEVFISVKGLHISFMVWIHKHQCNHIL